MTIFRRVLNTQRPGSGTLKGFRARYNGISTYEQTRTGFSYFYCKRRVLNDGVSTEPLDLELTPVKRVEASNEELDDDDLRLIRLLETNIEDT